MGGSLIELIIQQTQYRLHYTSMGQLEKENSAIYWSALENRQLKIFRNQNITTLCTNKEYTYVEKKGIACMFQITLTY